ncbi:hypothetical protein RDI58_017443 [Solanum bulbocastanum]|uniref:Uncharacterized protein n=1 Tax=Solanum bulbocastanum TaxID=147425 RepID=A0AAN8T9V7_SOLBU
MKNNQNCKILYEENRPMAATILFAEFSDPEHFQNSRLVESVLDVYWELPPVAGPSLTHQMRYDPARASSPIVEDGRYGLFRRLGLSGPEASVINGYTQMVLSSGVKRMRFWLPLQISCSFVLAIFVFTVLLVLSGATLQRPSLHCNRFYSYNLSDVHLSPGHSDVCAE